MERKEVQRLFMQHYTKMLRVARTILGDEQESKDVVSDIFANLLHGRTALALGTAETGSEVTVDNGASKAEERYLLTSVRNQCLKRLRHEGVRLRMEATAVHEQSMAVRIYGATDGMTDDERLTDIEEFVSQRLSSQERRIFRLRFADGCTYEEIAEQEGISRVAVWKHLSHALNLIRNHFKKQ